MSIDCYCKGHESYYECPVNYYECKPNYPVPAVVRCEYTKSGIYIYNVDTEATAFYGPLHSWRYHA